MKRQTRHEREWLQALSAWTLLSLLNGWVRPRDRKYRLYASALCRYLWDAFPEVGRRAVEVCEDASDGLVPDDERAQAAAAAYDAYISIRSARAVRVVDGQAGLPERAAQLAFMLAAWGSYGGSYAATRATKLAAEYASNVPAVALLRDIFGNPFRPAVFSPGWNTSTVVAIARQMYESRDFSPMPILADALQDAGCEHADVLGHCRGAGPHVRGCWVVDLVLGKS